jgi:phage-related protein (TIGR01555 family)
MTMRPATTLQRRMGKQFQTDSFVNFAANLGLGAQNLLSASQYALTPLSRNRQQLEMMYRGSWLVRQIVDAVAEDMTRAGIMLETDMEPDDEADLMEDWQTLQIWQHLQAALKWSRLYGGSLAVMMIDGQDPEKPLRTNTIMEEQFKGLMVLDRWMVNPSLEDTVRTLGPDFGLPKYYTIISDSKSIPGMRIHHSRCIRLEGADLPYWQKIAENSWGLSVIEPMYDRMVAFDSATAGAAQLVYKAHLRTLSVDKLRNLIAGGGKAYQAFLEQVSLIRLLQSSEGMTILDSSDKFEVHQYAFGGLSDVLIQFGQQVSGAAQIPLVRLFGQSPAGLNATGDSDIRNYYDMINAKQEAVLRRPVRILLEVMCRSKFGKPLPKGFNFSFRPLWQLAENEKATAANTVSEAVLSAFEQNVIGRKTVLKELREQSKVTGIFTNITDEEIEAAEDDPPAPDMGADPADAPSALAGQPGHAGPDADRLDRPSAAPFAAGAGASQGEGGKAADGLARRRLRRNLLARPGPLADLAKVVRDRNAGRDAGRASLDIVERVRRARMTPKARRIVEMFDQDRSLIEVHGVQCVIEAGKGERRGSWPGSMPAHYGYISGTGSAEGTAEQMDCFVGDNLKSPTAYIIHQHALDGSFDEHKVMLAFDNIEQAANAYMQSFSDGSGVQRLGKIYPMSIDQLKRWLRVWTYALPNVAERRASMNGHAR